MNLEEVARRAKVSTATVSRVLNNATVVKGSTRARVVKAIEELRYHPNLHARSLAGGKSRTLGVILSNMENPFFFDIYKSIESYAHAAGFEVVVSNTDYRAEQLSASLRLMIGRRVAGIAAIVSEMADELMDELNGANIPVVFYDVGAPRRNVANIRVNYRRGMDKVIDYLHSLGHRRLGFIGHHAALGPINERVKSVMDAVARIPALEVSTAADADNLEGGRLAARTLLDSGFAPTAILCVNDVMAVGALRELRERGLRVPLDVSVTGFDNVKLSEFCYPALTTVHIPRDRIGQTVSDYLTGRAAKGEPPARTDAAFSEVVIDPEFVLRDSTGPAPA